MSFFRTLKASEPNDLEIEPVILINTCSVRDQAEQKAIAKMLRSILVPLRWAAKVGRLKEQTYLRDASSEVIFRALS